jgi:hypothetical protein
VQLTGFAPVQVPPWHVSVWVQASPSLQALPFVADGFVHVPVAGLHAPATWHWSIAVQLTGFDPVHAPAWQVSVCVQASPSLQVTPSARFGLEHTPVAGLQLPAAWH